MTRRAAPLDHVGWREIVLLINVSVSQAMNNITEEEEEDAAKFCSIN